MITGNRVVLGAALVAAAFGQFLLLNDRGWAGAIVSLAAAALVGVVVPRTRATPRRRAMPTEPAPAVTRRPPEEAVNSVVAAGLLSVLAVVLLDVNAISWPVWSLQAAAIVAVIAAGMFADRHYKPVLPRYALRRSPIELSTATCQLLLCLIVIGGAWVRSVSLGDVPRGFWFDEADAGLLARRIAQDGFRPIFGGQVPAYDAYLIAGSTALFGESVAAVRAVSVVFGTLMIPAGYLVGRELFGKTAGVMVAFLIAFSRWAITLSRIGMNNVTLPLFALLALGLVMRGHRRRSHLDMALAGLAAGAGMLFYPAIASSLLAFAGFALYLVWSSRTGIRTTAAYGVLGLVGALVITAPLLKFAVVEPDRYFRRNRTTALWSEAGLLEGDTVWSGFVKSVRRYLPMTSYRGDNNGRHNIPGEPMYPPLVSGLSILGLGLLVARVDRRLSVLALLWIPLAFAPGVLSLPWEAPNALRAVGVLPIGVVLATAMLVAITRVTVRSQRSRQAAVAGIAVALAITGWIDVNAYFDANRSQGSVWAVHSTADTLAVELNAAAPDTTHVRVVSFLTNSRQRQFLTPDITFDAAFGSETPLPVTVPPGQDLLVLTTRESYETPEQAEQLYPNAVVRRQFENRTSDLIAIDIPARDIEATLGWTEREPGVFEAALLIDEAGDHRFRVGEGELLAFDGYDTSGCGDVGSVGVSLAAGLHLLTVRADQSPTLEWLTAGRTEWQAVPNERLVRAELIPGGLVTRHWADPSSAGPADLVEIDASLDLRMHELVLPRPVRTEWSGGLSIEESGTYTFGLRTDDELTLRIDGQVVATNGVDFAEQSFELELESGVHPIEVEYVDTGSRSEVMLRWTPPGSVTEPVPIPSSAFIPWLMTPILPEC